MDFHSIIDVTLIYILWSWNNLEVLNMYKKSMYILKKNSFENFEYNNSQLLLRFGQNLSRIFFLKLFKIKKIFEQDI